MGWFGNKDLGYEVYRPYKTNKYKIVTNEKYGCATEWVPVFKTRRKQEAIELTNALNNMDHLEWDKHRDIETKHYTFTWNGSRWEIKVADYTSFVGEDVSAGLLEIIYRKNQLIKKLKSKCVGAEYEAEKYKMMLFDLYDKMNEKSENDKYWEIYNLLYPKGTEDTHDKLSTQKTLDNIKQKLRDSIHNDAGF